MTTHIDKPHNLQAFHTSAHFAQSPGPKGRNAGIVFLILVITVLLLVGFGIKRASKQKGAGQEQPQTQPSNLSFLKVRGDKIVNVNGDAIFLRGFQGLGFYPIETDLYLAVVYEKGQDPYVFDTYAKDLAKYSIADFDINEIKSTGANVVRVWFNLEEIQKKPYVYSDVVLGIMEDKINQFGKAGIYVIPVLGCAGQHDFECNDWYEARGMSLWNKSSGLWDQSSGETAS